MQLCFAVISLD